MKKLFTLLLTLAFVLAVNAAPGTPKKGSFVKTIPFEKALAVKPAKSAQTLKAPHFQDIQKGMSLKQKNGKTVNISRTMKMACPTTAKMNKAPRKAEGKTIDIKVSGSYNFTYNDPTDECPTGDWYIGAADDTNGYVVRLDYLAPEDEKYGTFTLADLDQENSFIVDYTTTEEDNYYYYVEGTSFTVSQKDGHDVIEGTLVCSNGLTFNLYIEHIPETVNIEATELTAAYYFDSDMDWYIGFENEDYSISLDLISPDGSFDGTYTEDEAMITFCHATKLDTWDSYTFEKLNVTMKLAEGATAPSEGCEITGTGVTADGDTFNFHLLVGGPLTPTKVVDLDVDVKTAEWPSQKGGIKSYFEVTEKNNPENKWSLGMGLLQGKFNEEYIATAFSGRINTVTGDSLSINRGTITETIDPETYIVTVAADLVMSDTIEYRFSFDYAVETKGEVSYNYKNLVLDSSYYGWYGVQWLSASNDETSFAMTLADDVPGTYTDTSAFAAISYLDEEGNATTVIENATFFNAETTIDSNNQPVLNCRFLGKDMVVYNINAYFEIPTPVDTLDIVMDNLEAEDYTDSESLFEVYGYNEAKDKYLLLVTSATQIPGHYTSEDLAEHADYNYLVFINPEDQSYVINYFYSADFDVTKNDNEITVTGQFQAGNHWVNLTAHATLAVQGLDYDVADEDCDVTFTKEDLSELSKYEDQGFAYVRLQNAERNDMFAMLIYLDQYDDVSVIPEGTYEINGTYNVNTVQQGCLSSDYSTVYPTFYAYCTEDGYLNLPLWQFRSGTVTATKDAEGELAFEVNAQNSYNRTCHIVYNFNANGIKNVNAGNADSVKKMLDNHQVVIKKGDQKFTVVGQQLR